MPRCIGDLDAHLVHGSLGQPESTTKRHLDRFSHFCRAHDCNRLRDRPRYSLCNNGLHLHEMRSNNKFYNIVVTNGTNQWHTTPQPFYGPFSGTTQVSRCQKSNFWTLWCKGRLAEADIPTIWLGATPSRLTSAHLHHQPQIFYRPDALPAAQPTMSKHWRQLAHSR